MGLYQELPDNSYIKKLLLGIDDAFAERFLQMKKNYETATDKEDKRMYRDKLGNMFWELYPMIAKMINPELSTAKRLFLRYGLVDLRNLSPEDQKFILDQPVTPVDYETETMFYADEWLQGIVDGKIKPSAVDETEGSAATPTQTAQIVSGKQEKHIALLQVEKGRFDGFKEQRDKTLHDLSLIFEVLREIHADPDADTKYEGVYSAEQSKALDEIPALHKEIRKINKEMGLCARVMSKAQEALDELQMESGGGDGGGTAQGSSSNQESLMSEVSNLRQMVKMTVGRKGNPFPLLTSGFLPKESRDYLFKGIVRKKLNQWLALDPEAFERVYKGEVMNIMPYMILLPGYGVTGACWEALDGDNKQFGRGRVVLPIFTRSADLSLLTGVGDIRWQAAKEIASYYWMEEGLTGRYYEYYLEAKLKGDLKTLFITDYLIWMTKETQGVQKLEQNARYVFWRYVPLPQENKIKLSNKGYYYNQLWEKEQVWRQNKNA